MYFISPSLFGANNDFAEACKHNGGTKTLEFGHKLNRKNIHGKKTYKPDKTACVWPKIM